MKRFFVSASLALATFCSVAAIGTYAQTTSASQDRPWMNRALSPDERASLVLKEMTLDEKLSLLHGNGMAREPQWTMPLTSQSNGGAGYIAPIARLGIPAIDISDAAYGVRAAGSMGRYATALPSNLGAACSWDRKAAYAYGSLIARELRAQGFNMSLGGGVNLTREPRSGRTFEYLGEDPILAGTLVGQLMAAERAEHVISDIKHYAVNDQETGRSVLSSEISERAMRESDLLASRSASTTRSRAPLCALITASTATMRAKTTIYCERSSRKIGTIRVLSSPIGARFIRP
ncbi:beta-glucosidase-like glycosyl hydrolase [Silvibacterium bohemicum]|uniref:Beta-glucosidase-like glycosyl hydrolase n=1 Tax=Silvibacterium bohemicum TaxID=1577686 RepID=A0A841JW39_9BACT|nr:beta-glucosidase-like glycosyl hydrolase [Silvibacterium bohemicum]